MRLLVTLWWCYSIRDDEHQGQDCLQCCIARTLSLVCGMPQSHHALDAVGTKAAEAAADWHGLSRLSQ